MSNTTVMRQAWAPACKPHRGTMLPAYRALDAVLLKWDYKPEAGHTGSFVCRAITGGTAYSLHAYEDGDRFTFWSGVPVTMAVAVDINWRDNPYGRRLVTNMPRGMVEEICALRTGNGKQVWGWGGYWSGNKDAMHFELRVTAADLRTGIRGSSRVVAAHAITITPPKETFLMALSDEQQKQLFETVVSLKAEVDRLTALAPRFVLDKGHPQGAVYVVDAAGTSRRWVSSNPRLDTLRAVYPARFEEWAPEDVADVPLIGPPPPSA